MNIRLSRLAPIEDVLLALVSTTVWFAILWVVDYPVDYWAVMVVTTYVALWASRAIISRLTLFLFGRLRRKMQRVVKRLDIDLPTPAEIEYVPGVKLIGNLILLSVLSTILGSTVLSTLMVSPVVGLPSLGVQFLVVGSTLLALGLVVLVPFFVLSFTLFTNPNTLSEVLSSRVSRIEQSEAAISRSRLLMGQRQAA